MDISQYFYLIGSSCLIPIWLIIFLKRPNSRSDMLFIGSLFAIAALFFDYIYARFDYWHPNYITEFLLEDWLYGFLIGGISAELSEFLLKVKNIKSKNYIFSLKLFLLFVSITFLTIIISIHIFKLNSIVAHIVPPALIGIIQIYIDHRFLKFNLINALAITFITIVMFHILLKLNPELFYDYWYLQNLSGIFILKIPIEELLFSFSIGFGAASLFETLIGASYKSKITK